MPKQTRLLIPVAHLVLDLYTESLGISPTVAHLVRDSLVVQILVLSTCCLLELRPKLYFICGECIWTVLPCRLSTKTKNAV